MRHGNYQKYTHPNPLQQRLIRSFLSTVADMVERSSVRTVLDVGCAEGFVSQHVRRYVDGVILFGVDLDVKALARGRVLHPGLRMVVGDALNLPMGNGCVDMVMCTEVLEHIPTPERALAELTRVTRGHLLLSVPWEPWFRLANLARLKNISRLGNDPEHVNHWTARGFRRFLHQYVEVIEHHITFPWQIILAHTR